jgi:uncharacterized protein
MDMNFPLFKYGYFNDEVSLIVAVFIGIGFGFFLERAGFGSSTKLAAQFYFTDLTVLKVMFTAIITAMTGLFYLSWMGIVDLSLVYLTPTFILPQIVGGLLLGVGFVVGGYCPGTSIVGAATGRTDGWVNLLGVIFGILVFGEVFPVFKDFYTSTSMGQITISQYFNIPYGILVFAVVVMALGAFALAGWTEKKFASKKAGV